MVDQGTPFIGLEVTYFILSSHINPSMTIKTNGTHNRRIGQWIHVPIPSIKRKQSLVISKIQYPLRILCHSPVLNASTIYLTGVVYNLGHRNSTLCVDYPTKNYN